MRTTIRSKAERGLLLAILLSGVTLILEVAGGILSGSLALLSDAVHVLLDLLSLLLSYGAIRVALLPPTDTRTFHVEVSPSHASRRGEVLEAIRATLRREYHIEHVTMQPECGPECMLPTAPALRHEGDNPNADTAGGSPSL